MLEIMIDCGTDWLGRLTAIAPTAILLTHAHPDHAGGLAQGAPCPVYATSETLRLVRRCPLRDRRRMPIKKAITIGGITFKAYPVQHSIRAPATFNYPQFRMRLRGTSGDENLNLEKSFVICC